MRQHPVIALHDPVGGLYRARGYQHQAPYTSETLLNVRPFDVVENRGRIGSRPGLVKAFGEQLGGGFPVRLMSYARRALTTSRAFFLDLFDDTSGPTPVPLGPEWSVLPWRSDPMVVAENAAQPEATGFLHDAGSYNDTIVSASRDSEQTIVVLLSQFINVGDKLSLYLFQQNPPIEDDGLRLDFYINYNTQKYVAELYRGATLKLTGTQTLQAGNPIIIITIKARAEPTTFAAVYMEPIGISGPVLMMQYSLGGGTGTGSVFGFGLIGATVPQGTQARADYLRFEYSALDQEFPLEGLIASANKQVYSERLSGTLEEATGLAIDLTDSRRIYAQPYLQRSIVADYEIRRERLSESVNATISSVSSGVAKLADTDVADWDALGIDTDGDVLEIISAGGGSGTVQLRPYEMTIASQANGGITFIVADDGTHTATSVAYRVLRYYKIFDPTAGTLTRHPIGSLSFVSGSPTEVAASSVAPAGCRSIRLWSGRIVFCNNAIAPHGWWMSAVNYPYLYDYGDSGLLGENGLTSDPVKLTLGVAAAASSDQPEFYGLMGEPLTTTIPITDDLLIFACRTSFYYLTGNPREGGRPNNITTDVGIDSIDAWCRSSEGRLFILTYDGLYEITTERAIPLSRQHIPGELLGITDDEYDISLAYDAPKQEVVIACTRKDVGVVAGGESETAGVHYRYSLRTGGFFPDLLVSQLEATAVTSYQPGGQGLPVVVYGGRDGYVRRFDDAAQDDDGVNFNTHARYGPIQLGGGLSHKGTLHEMVVALDTLSGSVTVEIRTGKSPQEAAESAPRYSTTLVAGANRPRYPRLTDGCAYIDVVGTPGSAWAMGGIEVSRETRGRVKNP